MKNPKYAKSDVKPTFKKITAEELRAGIKVVSGRSTALFGFNGPSVEVHLPRIDNSAYVVDKWDTPRLLDSRERVIGFEKEQGLYDHTTFSTEIRFRSGSDKPPEIAKAIGSMTISYPLSMKTVSIKKTDTARAGELGVEMNGPMVKVYSDHVAEAAWGNEIEAVRVYDKAGKRIERVAGYSSSGFDEGGNYQQWAYHGEAARVDVDVIESRAGFRIDYEMPPVPPLPNSKAGAMSAALETVPETPGGKFTLTPFRVIPPAALGGYASYSADEAKESLIQNYEVREVDDETLMRAAVEGNLDIVQLCLAAGVDPDVRSDDNTPLLMAATLAHVEVAKTLIAAGADVNAKNQNNATPLLQAAGRCEASELIRALIKAGADVNVKALGGITALGMADAVKCTENAKALKAAGAK
ncbi:MAG: ankyrin repeat domain-containing protein [Thermoanaerobaculia bacterium]